MTAQGFVSLFSCFLWILWKLWILLRILLRMLLLILLWILWIHGFCFCFLLVKDAGTTETVGPSMAEVGFLSLAGRGVRYLLVRGGLS